MELLQKPPVILLGLESNNCVSVGPHLPKKHVLTVQKVIKVHFFSEKFGKSRRDSFGGGYCSDALFRKETMLESTDRQPWVREGLESSILERTAFPTLNQHIYSQIHSPSHSLHQVHLTSIGRNKVVSKSYQSHCEQKRCLSPWK